MDPSPLPKDRRLTQDDLKARTRKMAPAQAEAARGRLEAFLNALIEASITVLTGEERAAYDGCTGLDATPVPLFSRGPSKRTGLCASDPDGGWYVREGDHREREDDKGKPLRKICWALEATIATMARPPGAPPAHPDLAIGLSLARPGEDPGGTGARVLASIAARGHKAGWLGYDRAYTQALPARFHLPARALGYKPVMDYRADQLGIQANTGGAILVEGTWYCPALPGPLITATTSLRDHAITRDLYDQQITARACYQLKHKDGPDADGYQRLSCPAAGRRPGLICPLRKTSLITPRRTRQGTPATARTAQDLHPDRDHHRPRHRRPVPPGPALRQPRLAQDLRDLAQHHRRPQRARQRPRPRSPRPARPAPRPRHRRPVHLHRPAAHRRQHPQDPRLARPHRPRQGPHHPPGPAAPDQPARLPPRRLTRTASSPRHPGTCNPAGQPRPRPARSTRSRPGATPGQAGQRPAPVSEPGVILKIRSPPQFCRYDTGSSVGNPWCPRGDLNPLVVVHPRIGDLSPVQANTTRAGRARISQTKRGGSTGPPGRSRRVTCGNDEGGQPEWGRRPGPDCGSRITALNHQGSTVTASRCCPAVPAPQPQPRKPAQMTLPPS